MPTPEQRQDFRKALRAARDEAGLSTRALGDLAGVTQSAVWQYEEGKAVPRLEVVTELERVLKLDAGWLTRQLGYLPVSVADRSVSSVLEAVEADPKLGDRERAILRTVYRELAQESDSAVAPSEPAP